jgi:glycosyltransferase involved in cell wall biosynthesis
MSRVAVVTRTKDRPLLLPRARDSVSQQTCRNLVWVIVNDAGDPAIVDAEAAAAREAGVEVEVVHRDRSTGMEAASNAGVRAVASDYIVIHDDDDSWHPEFLERTVAFLDAEPHYVGVVTRCYRVDERLDGDTVREVKRRVYNPGLIHIRMADLAMQNRFPPISFVFRRSVYEEAGGFDEALPVLGDWDFHLRCCLCGDIAVLRDVLANYHHRKAGAPTPAVYGNTVTAGVSQHVEYDAIYRNRKLREDLEANRIGLGVLLYQSTLAHQLGQRVDRSGSRGMLRVLLKLAGRVGKRLRLRSA